jgi:DNA-binding transcriptional ArsR family regulator
MKKTDVLAALSSIAHENRLDIFRMLVRAGAAGLAAGAIGERLGLPAPTLSFHLAQLRRAGLIAQSREGRSLVYTAYYARMSDLLSYITEHCCRADGAAVCAPGSAACVPKPRPIKTRARSLS